MGDDLHTAKGQEEGDGNLASLWDGQVSQDDEGDNQHHEIDGSVPGRVEEPENANVDARARAASVPKVADRSAHEDVGEQDGDELCGDDDHHGLAHSFWDGVLAADSEIEQEDGDLDEVDAKVVEQSAGVERDEGIDNLGLWQGPDMPSGTRVEADPIADGDTNGEDLETRAQVSWSGSVFALKRGRMGVY